MARLVTVIDTVAWVHLVNGKILCARPRGKDVFYVPGGKREGAESDLQTLLREIAEELTVALRPGRSGTRAPTRRITQTARSCG